MGAQGKKYSTAVVHLAAADASKEIVAAPAAGTGLTIRVRRARYISKTSAAQALQLKIGTAVLLDLAASITAHAVIDTGVMETSFPGQLETALTANPAAAGPAGTFIVDYYVE